MLVKKLQVIPTSTGGTQRLRLFWKKSDSKEELNIWRDKIDNLVGLKAWNLGVDPEDIVSFEEWFHDTTTKLDGCGTSECHIHIYREGVIVRLTAVEHESIEIERFGNDFEVEFNIGTKNNPYFIKIFDTANFIQVVTQRWHQDSGRYDEFFIVAAKNSESLENLEYDPYYTL